MPSISNLPLLTIATGTVEFPVVDYSTNPDTTRKATWLQFRNYLNDTSAVKTVAGRIGDIVLTYSDVGGLSTVANSGSYNDLLDKPTVFPISTASTNTLGGVKIDGVTITIDDNGVISGALTYTLPQATTSTLGGVIIGDNINLDSGVISINTATTSTLGLIKIGNNLSISADGTLNSLPGYTLPIANTSTLGGIKIGNGIAVDPDGTIHLDNVGANTAARFLTINSGESGYGITGGIPGDNLYRSAGIQIFRGSALSSYILYSDNYNVDDGVTQTTGTFVLSSNGGAGTLMVNKLRIAPDQGELNIFGANNPGAVLSVKGTYFYEHNVTDDNHIPNKKYVDNKIHVATVSSTGTVKIGSGISVTGDGTISVAVLSTATASTLGGIKIGSNIIAAGDGTISVAGPYSLTTATASTLGGIKLGSGLAGTGDGTVYVTISGGGGSITSKDEGITLSTQTFSLNFIGAGVTATNVGNDITVRVDGGGGGGGGGGGLTSRTSAAVTSDSLTAGSSGNYTITGFKGYALLSIQTSAAAWVTVYSSAAAQSADALRFITSDPNPGSGVIAEVITTSGTTQYFSPAFIGYSSESSPSTSIPIKIYNNGASTTAITVTLTMIQLEA
jgi:hypothetical protein